jgi:hypothetical protein
VLHITLATKSVVTRFIYGIPRTLSNEFSTHVENHERSFESGKSVPDPATSVTKALRSATLSIAEATTGALVAPVTVGHLLFQNSHTTEDVAGQVWRDTKAQDKSLRIMGPQG